MLLENLSTSLIDQVHPVALLSNCETKGAWHLKVGFVEAKMILYKR